jgi:proline iminopeptidase
MDVSVPADAVHRLPRVQISVGDVRLFVDVDGAKVRPVAGQSNEVPTVAVVHDGPGADHTTFKQAPFADPLRRVAQLLFYDQRGNGRSDPSSSDKWRLDVWADDLRGLLDVLGVDEPIVFGSGFGALVATRFASRHPDRLARLILNRPMARFDAARCVDTFARIAGPDAAEAVLAFYATPNEATYPAYIMTVMRAFTNTTPAEVAELLLSAEWLSAPTVHWFAGEAREFDLRPDAQRIRVPTLVLGGEDDALSPIACVEELVDAFDPELVRFERFPTRHAIYSDDPRAMDVTLEFVTGG